MVASVSVPPLFIVGAGRSGSTMLMKLLSSHPNIAWLSPISHRYPTRLGWQRGVLALADAPGVGRWVRGRLGPREAYAFWETHSPGFKAPHRDLVAADVTASRRRQLITAVDSIRTAQRFAFVAKLTGWPRVLFLHEVFPDARFVHLVRDGRAVAASFSRMTVEKWGGWRGPESWLFGKLDPRNQARWDATGQSYFALAGIQWSLVLDAIERARPTLGAAMIDVRYEDLCGTPGTVIQSILDHGGIPASAELDAVVAAHRVDERNDAWRQEFDASQQAMLTELLREHLTRYGYEA
jgi:LPS sulfotransferase NodH